MKPRKIAVVTGTRAEYGLLSPIIEQIAADRALRLQLIVTGSHLDPRFGRTVSEIEKDGWPIAARVPLRRRGDEALGVAEAMASGLSGFARAYARLKPDIVVLLGDRYELLSAAAAALPFRIPLAHVHGGESSEGVWDEAIRHALTKLSHLHFPAHPVYARRLLRMGEQPGRVHCFGSPGVDRVRALAAAPREELERRLGLRLEKPVVVATYHPSTLAADRGASELEAMLGALAGLKGTIVLTYPNADAGGAAMIGRLDRFARAHRGRAVAVASLGQRLYFSLLRRADAMVGNSSSGLLEAPYFALPVVNLGERQRGRLRPGRVFDVPRPTKASVAAALSRALAAPRLRPAKAAGSPSRRIVAILKKIRLDDAFLMKSFYEAR